MKKINLFLTISILIVGTFATLMAQDKKGLNNASVEKIWETPNVLTTCESVFFDKTRNILYVSCINGNPVDKDFNGFIARVTTDGRVTDDKWITGLNAPKGMGLIGNNLYVADIDRIVEINVDNPEISKEYPVEGAKFLNDITTDPQGNVYVSDMANNTIIRLKNGKVEIWLNDDEIKSPNGLYFENGDLLIGTSVGIFSVRETDKKTWLLIKISGGIDGLQPDGKGNYIISDWKGKIQIVNTTDEPVVLSNTSDKGINAADLNYVREKGILYVPTFGDNRVMAYKVFYK